MRAGGGDLFEIPAQPLFITDMQLRQFGHSDDRVHRRTNVVAHAREKGALGLAGVFRLLQGVFQQLFRLTLLLQSLLLHPAFIVDVP